MADTKISALTAVTTPAGTDEFAVNQGGTSKKVTLSQILAGGSLVLLEQHTASASASLDFTTFISSTYDDYLFRLIGIVPVTNNVDFYIQCSTGSTWDTAAHYLNNHYLQASSGNTTVVGTSDKILIRGAGEISNAAATGLSGKLDLFAPGSTVLVKRFGGEIRWCGASNWINNIMDAYWNQSASAMDGVRFYFSSGNIASGTIRVYGIAK